MATATLLSEDWTQFPVGLFSADVGPHTEYHYLPEAAPKGGWSVAAFASRKTGRAWWIEEVDGRHVMHQTLEEERVQTHPMLRAGKEEWADYTLTVTLRPLSETGRTGIAFRYRNNRCYYYLGFADDQIVLQMVQQEVGFHRPYEKDLAAIEHVREPGRDYTFRISGEGPKLTAEVEEVGAIEATDETYEAGGIGLLSDNPAMFLSVEVAATEEEESRVHVARWKKSRELDELREANPKPVLWRKFPTECFGAARNLRFGDLTGNGTPDLVIGQLNHRGERDTYSELGCITAMTFDGDILWQSGEPDAEAYSLTCDVAFQIHDIDGDGRNELVYARDFELIVADGATGETKYSTPTPLAKPPADRFERILGDCLFFCDVRGAGRMADIVIKDRYWHFWVLDDTLNPLWDGACRTGHYPFAADVDGDGRDELFMGYALFDDDGTLLWNLEDRIQDHVDGVAAVDFGERPDSETKILYAGSDAGLLLVDLEGNILVHHGIGHAQNPAVAKFRRDLPGLQAVSINFWGSQGTLHFYDGEGNIYHDCEPLNMGSMCLPVNWTGDGVEFFVHNPNPRWGGMFDGWGRPVVTFPDDGHPDMCNAVLDITGDCRDEVVVWDPHELWVYTQDDNPKSGRLYKPRRNPLANYSNYQATVSLPDWGDEK